MFSGNQSLVLLISGSITHICIVLTFSSYSANFIPVLAMVALEIKENCDFAKPKDTLLRAPQQ